MQLPKERGLHVIRLRPGHLTYEHLVVREMPTYCRPQLLLFECDFRDAFDVLEWSKFNFKLVANY